MAHYLILEDDDNYFNQIYEPAYRDKQGTDEQFSYKRVKTVDDAHAELARERFTCAILDLRLVSGGTADGNEVAKKIHSDYLLPVAVVTGFEDELEPALKEIAAKSCFFKLFNKSGRISEVFDFINIGAKSGVLQMLGPGGEFPKMISEIFWNHLGSVVEKSLSITMSADEKRRLMRHAVSHMISALLSADNGNWDNFLHEEIYIWPAICNIETTGDIYEGIAVDGEDNGFFVMVTPSCDVGKPDMQFRHFVRVTPFNKFRENQIANMVDKKNFRYHVLPPTAFYVGGVADFASVISLSSQDISTRLTRKGSLIEPYWRELVNRLGIWVSRQGTPDFEKTALISEIKKQFTQSASTTATPT